MSNAEFGSTPRGVAGYALASAGSSSRLSSGASVPDVFRCLRKRRIGLCLRPASPWFGVPPSGGPGREGIHAPCLDIRPPRKRGTPSVPRRSRSLPMRLTFSKLRCGGAEEQCARLRFWRRHGSARPQARRSFALAAPVRGLNQRKPVNRMKSVSFVWRVAPCSIASAAICASVTRFPAVPSFSSELSTGSM